MTSTRHRVAARLTVVTALLGILALFPGCGDDPEPRVVRVGVLLPSSGPTALPWARALEWAVENVNAAGGVAGHRLELVYRDTGSLALRDAAQELADDPTVVAVIGPDSSDAAFDVVPLFTDAEKVLVSPSATSAELFRAFAGGGYFWRTVSSDTAQVRAMLLAAEEAGHQRVALVSVADRYGSTFFDWFGFFALELGLEAATPVRLAPDETDCETEVAQALANAPDLLLVAVGDPAAATCIARAAAQLAPETRLLFADAIEAHYLLRDLGDEAEGLEGLRIAAAPESGFAEAHAARYDEEPAEYAATTYDAVVLLAAGLEATAGEGGPALADALAQVAVGKGAATGWDAAGVAATLQAVARGETPDLVGAGGPLDFDPVVETETTATTYVHWRIVDGAVEDQESYTSGEGESLDRSFASAALTQDLSDTGDFEAPPRTGSWALVAALSSGWSNYRHQADALAQYRLLRDGGLDDDHIILVLADDLAGSGHNPTPGEVRVEADGPDLYGDVAIDYHLDQVTSYDLMRILTGETTAALPTVVESGPGDAIYVFLSGHGSDDGLEVGTTDGLGWGATVSTLTPKLLGKTLDGMYQDGRYQRVLLAIEACHAGVMGRAVAAPGVILLAGASATENSVSANYDPGGDTWLADRFSFELYQYALEVPDSRIDALYEALFARVPASHVQVAAPQAGNLATIGLDNFIAAP